MNFLLLFVIVIIAGIFVLPFINLESKTKVTLLIIGAAGLLAALPAIATLMGIRIDLFSFDTLYWGVVDFKLDSLSAWFIIIINIGLFTGAGYGFNYLKAYKSDNKTLNLHIVCLLLLQGSLVFICLVQHTLFFLVLLELISITAFILVIFEYQKKETLKAGLNYLIQSHIAIVFLTIAFIWIAQTTGSYQMSAFGDFSQNATSGEFKLLFLILLAGFSLKAGFIPFHTWLPHAHPAAPAHISGIMSGVIIKIGLFGLLRFIFFARSGFDFIGNTILLLSVITGLYGILQAAFQRNLKKLLAYSSIENIGIAGIGIGIGSLGVHNGNALLILCGFGGTLLHIFNHTLYKSLLFYLAGIVYQSTHKLDMEQLGGLARRMPKTTGFFILASVAICGLPPLNGFISELMLYSGLFNAVTTPNIAHPFIFILSIAGLALIGGLAVITFTKAIGIAFLGTERIPYQTEVTEPATKNMWPLYVLSVCMACIGLFPSVFVKIAAIPLQLLPVMILNNPIGPIQNLTNTMQNISLFVWLFLVIFGIIWYYRNKTSTVIPAQTGPTWGCGYTNPTPRIQYTGSSFVRTLLSLTAPLAGIRKIKKIPVEVFPQGSHELRSESFDKLESNLIKKPIEQIVGLFDRLSFLQNGQIQSYIMYGLVFIIAIVLFSITGII